MERFPHYIKEVKTNECPQQCIWVDTETLMTKVDKDPTNDTKALWYSTITEYQTEPGETVYHWLKFGRAVYMRKHHNGVWGDEEWISFTTRNQFWDFVCRKVRRKAKLYIFCHNAAFDMPVLDVFAELPKHGYILKSAVIESPPTILKFRNDSKCIVVVDTLNIWRMSLKFLGKEIGLPKYEMPSDGNINVDWEQYTDRDVEIIRTACLKWFAFLEHEDLGAFCPTLASQSMRAYRHRFMRHRIFIDINERALDLTREGYYGGRVECFRIGKFKGLFQSFDVNSMYPYVMANGRYPCKLLSYTAIATVSDLRAWLTRYCVTARVVIRTDRAFVPVKSGDKLVFPVGQFECIMSSPELLYALQHCEVVRVREVAIYESAPLFVDFVQTLYAKRMQAKADGDEVTAFLYKKLLNSFYGKWGQSGGKWYEYTNTLDLSAKTWIDHDIDTGETVQWRQLGGLVQRKEPKGEAKESFPAIAAHITAEARICLYRLLDLAGLENCYYCDTDSLLVNEAGAARLTDQLHETRLGGLKLAGTYDEIELWGPKDYRFGTKAKTKGVRDTAIWIDSHTISQAKWSGLRGMLSSGVLNRPSTETIIKHLSRTYDKGIVLPDGTVQPHLFAESDSHVESDLLLDPDAAL